MKILYNSNVIFGATLKKISIFILFFLLVPWSANGQENSDRYSQRHLVVPHLSLEILAGPLNDFGAAGFIFENKTENILEEKNGIFVAKKKSRKAGAIDLGAVYGLTQDLTFGGVLLRSEWNRALAFHNPSLFSRYRFFRRKIEIATDFGLSFPLTGGAFNMSFGFPMRYRGDLRIDISPRLHFGFGDTGLSLSSPISIFYNLTPRAFVGLNSGISAANSFSVLRLPIGLGIGYAFSESSKTRFDLTTSLDFPGIIRSAGKTRLQFESWKFRVGVNYRFNFR